MNSDLLGERFSGRKPWRQKHGFLKTKDKSTGTFPPFHTSTSRVHQHDSSFTSPCLHLRSSCWSASESMCSNLSKTVLTCSCFCRPVRRSKTEPAQSRHNRLCLSSDTMNNTNETNSSHPLHSFIHIRTWGWSVWCFWSGGLVSDPQWTVIHIHGGYELWLGAFRAALLLTSSLLTLCLGQKVKTFFFFRGIRDKNCWESWFYKTANTTFAAAPDKVTSSQQTTCTWLPFRTALLSVSLHNR